MADSDLQLIAHTLKITRILNNKIFSNCINDLSNFKDVSLLSKGDPSSPYGGLYLFSAVEKDLNRSVLIKVFYDSNLKPDTKKVNKVEYDYSVYFDYHPNLHQIYICFQGDISSLVGLCQELGNKVEPLNTISICDTLPPFTLYDLFNNKNNIIHEEDKLHICSQIAKGLYYLYCNKMIHKSIDIRNIYYNLETKKITLTNFQDIIIVDENYDQDLSKLHSPFLFLYPAQLQLHLYHYNRSINSRSKSDYSLPQKVNLKKLPTWQLGNIFYFVFFEEAMYDTKIHRITPSNQDYPPLELEKKNFIARDNIVHFLNITMGKEEDRPIFEEIHSYIDNNLIGNVSNK